MSAVPAAMPGRRRFSAYNPTAEIVPPFAAVELSAITAEGAYILRKPDRDDSPTAFFNTDTSIAPYGYGTVTKHLPTWARYNPVDGDPVNGESLGTRAGYWQLHRGYEGFLVWGSADGEKVYVQSDLTCRESGGNQYYYSGRLGNPFFNNNCYGCTDLMLPSVICANHVGSTGHDSGFFMKRWNGGYSHPVPWLPAWTTTSELGGYDYTFPGWYSDLIDDFECHHHYEWDDDLGRHHTADWTDHYYYFYSYILCEMYLHQLVVRTGTYTITGGGYPTVTASMNHPGFGVGVMQTVCAGTAVCSPFSVRLYLGYVGGTPDLQKIRCACPTYTPPLAIIVGSSLPNPTGFPCLEPGATSIPSCAGQYVDLFACGNGVDVPSWSPPPAKGLPGFQSNNYGNGGFQANAFQME